MSIYPAMPQGGFQAGSSCYDWFTTFSEHRYLGRFLKYPLELPGASESPLISQPCGDFVLRQLNPITGETKCFVTSLAAFVALAPNLEPKVYLDTDTGMHTITIVKEHLLDVNDVEMGLFAEYLNTGKYYFFGDNVHRGMKTDITMMKIAECTDSPILMMHGAQNLLHWIGASSTDPTDLLIAIKANWNEIRALNGDLSRSFAMLSLAHLSTWKELDQRQSWFFVPVDFLTNLLNELIGPNTEIFDISSLIHENFPPTWAELLTS